MMHMKKEELKHYLQMAQSSIPLLDKGQVEKAFPTLGALKYGYGLYVWLQLQRY